MNLLECWRQFVFEIIREGVTVSWRKQLVVSQLNAGCETSQFYAFLPAESWAAFFPFCTFCKGEDGHWDTTNGDVHFAIHFQVSLLK